MKKLFLSPISIIKMSVKRNIYQILSLYNNILKTIIDFI